MKLPESPSTEPKVAIQSEEPKPVHPELILEKETPFPQPQRAGKPLAARLEGRSSFNLKTIFDKVEEEKPVIEKRNDLPKEDFREKDVFDAWNGFLDSLKAENKIPAYNALHTAKVSLKESLCIAFEFSSLSLTTEFELQKDALMRVMRDQLQNYFIEFEVDIYEEPTRNYVKSKAEIFQEMAAKNPVLLKMKNEFGLDFNSND